MTPTVALPASGCNARAASSQPVLLNLGCGSRFHPAWVNADLVPRAEGVLRCDVRAGLPFPGESFDAVYHAHVLEHLPRDGALSLLRECRRVLRPGGTIRVVVPDLEQVARLYLDALARAQTGDPEWAGRYEWMMLELYDQTVRERSGGEMARYLQQPMVPSAAFVLERAGDEARHIMEAAARKRASAGPRARQPSRRAGIICRIRRFLFEPVSRRETVARWLLGPAYEYHRLGQFRRGGEVHLWMYDRYSLGVLLGRAGFENPRPVAAGESRIPDWNSYELDTDQQGAARKPESLYMEAERP